MKMKLTNSFVLVAVILLALTLSGCGSSMMTRVARMDAPSDGYALVSFVRPSVFGGAIKFGLWDSDKFIGILTAKSVVQYKVKPGKHLFIARAENWSYVEADLAAGKHYVIVGRVFPGVWKARVGMDPANSPEETRADVTKFVNRLNPIGVMEGTREPYESARVDHVKKAIDKFQAGEVKYATLSADAGI